jgi:glucosamine--fructose-6-phosphate aminotransferase (isomerizing)
MCGIVGIVSSDEVAPLLVKSIARLEYRGYDSCGVATLGPTGIEVRKDAGAVEEVAFREGLAWLAGPSASYIRAGRLTRWYRRPMRTRT